MEESSRLIRRCDPRGGHVEGSTFAEMYGVFQSYIANEADMSTPGDSCLFDCPGLTYQKHIRHSAEPSTYLSHWDCEGIITHCQTAPKRMEICVEGNGFPRRYRSIKGSNGEVWGDDSDCKGQMKSLSSWHRFLVVCDYCICTCESTKTGNPPLGLISFLPSEADIQNNMVVVGVKIVRANNTIYVQVKERKLEANGSISKGSDRWVPLRYLMSSESSMFSSEGKRLIRTIDYDAFHGNNRKLNLDDVFVPENHLVAGVRFKHMREIQTHKRDNRIPVDMDYANPIQLEVLAIPFDYETAHVRGGEWAELGPGPVA
ncbi:uncharacterized protein LOC107037973, partial [Diachasma alloeum]|uniref:uncharacterized protein LOC107037973 n=1 Tax=Diachasma alloeum TaxID=454923 RepID=UPI00073841C3